MPDKIGDMLAAAKKTLAQANTTFPSPKPAAPAIKSPAPKPSQPAGIGEELKAKAGMVAKGRQALGAPKMHTGGPVLSDGIYRLKAGEHVLTEPEAKLARKHALMASGMKSLTTPGKSAKKSQ